MAEKIEFQVSLTRDELTKALERAGDAAEQTEKKVKDLGGAFGDINKEVGRIKANFIGGLAANVVSKGLDIVAAGFRDVITESRNFSRAIAEINSTLPKSAKLTNDQALALAQVSEKFGTSSTAQAKGFFEAVSNGVEDSAVAFNILTNANNAALSGLVDINTAARLVTTTFNAYKSSGTTVAEITDTLVAVTQASGAKFEELAQSMGRVTNVAAQSGISIGELGGTIAFLNARSLTTEQAITGIAGAIGDISKPTKEAAAEAARLGINFNATALKSKGLVKFLEEVTAATGGNITSLRTLFGDQRSANAVVAIATSKFSEYKDVIDKVTKSQGEASRASAIIKESLDFKLSTLNSQFNSLAISIGQKLTPLIIQATNAISGLKSLLDGQPKSIDENRNKLQALGVEYNNTTTRVNALKKEITSLEALGGGSGLALAQEQLNQALEKQNRILEERRKLRGSPSKPADDAAATPVVDTAEDQAIVQARKDTFNQLLIARTDFDAFNAQLNVDQRALAGTVRQEDLDALILAEQAKIDAQFAAETEKTKLILDETTRRNGLLAIETKKEQAQKTLQAKRDTDFKKGQIQLEQTFQNQRNSILSSSFGLAAALAKDGSKTQFLIQKAAALAEIGIARGKAIALIPAQTAHIPFPGNVAPAAALLANANIQAAIGAATVAATAIKGFANGGIVGNGATSGPDNQIASIRTGELILNASQQKTLFDAINSGSFSGGDIVVKIDSREIARATRDQIRSGFILA